MMNTGVFKIKIAGVMGAREMKKKWYWWPSKARAQRSGQWAPGMLQLQQEKLTCCFSRYHCT